MLTQTLSGDMAINIGIAEHDTSLVSSRKTPTVSLDNDGYYWYLHPLLEVLQGQTGQYIDLYGNASFSGSALTGFGEMLSEATRLIARQPDTWNVHVGTQFAPEKNELYSTVLKSKIAELIHQLVDIAAMAERMDRPIVCFGD